MNVAETLTAADLETLARKLLLRESQVEASRYSLRTARSNSVRSFYTDEVAKLEARWEEEAPFRTLREKVEASRFNQRRWKPNTWACRENGEVVEYTTEHVFNALMAA